MLTRRGKRVLYGGAFVAGVLLGASCTVPGSQSAPMPLAPPLTAREATAGEVEALTYRYGPVRLERAKRPSRDTDRQPACRDRIARTLQAAGFRGDSLRTAWAIVMRESRGEPLDESSPWYTGALGIWQVQTSAHSGKPWWSRSAMLDPAKQSRLVYLHLSNRGRDFRHWGIGPGGSTDTTFYGGWSDSQVWAWITEPFQRHYAQYPC